MKYIVLDDEIIAADYLAELIKENDNNASVTVLNNPCLLYTSDAADEL